MKVRDLIEYLQDMDENAEVLIGSQPSWPFEYSIQGVATREEVLKSAREDAWGDEEGHYDEETGEPIHDEDMEDENDLGDGCHLNDVFLVEGTQLRYGNKAMWDAANG